MVMSVDHYRAVLTLPARSGITQDNIEMTLCFKSDTVSPTTTDFDNLRNDIKSFFHTTPTGGSGNVGSYMSYAINASACRIDVYNIPPLLASMGSPDYTSSWTFTLGGTSSTSHVPQEVACCVTFEADMTDVPVAEGDTRPQQSHRGRIYLGPIQDNAVTINVTTGVPRPSATMIDDILKAAKQFLGTAAAGHGWHQAIHSRKLWDAFPVIEVSVDDAFDTQRRRGQAPTARTRLAY